MSFFKFNLFFFKESIMALTFDLMDRHTRLSQLQFYSFSSSSNSSSNASDLQAVYCTLFF